MYSLHAMSMLQELEHSMNSMYWGFCNLSSPPPPPPPPPPLFPILLGFKSNPNLPQFSWTLWECPISVPNLWFWGASASLLQVIALVALTWLWHEFMMVTWPHITSGSVRCLVVSIAFEETYSLWWFPGRQTKSQELYVPQDKEYHARKSEIVSLLRAGWYTLASLAPSHISSTGKSLGTRLYLGMVIYAIG